MKLPNFLARQRFDFYLESGQVIKVRAVTATVRNPGTWEVTGLRGNARRPVHMVNVVALTGRRAPIWWPF